jgi:hypothetical protein
MTEPRKRRNFLGRANAFAIRQVVYAFDDGLEIDEFDHGLVTRKRVYYDDVLFVTQHCHRGVAFMVVTGSASLVLGLIALWIGLKNGWATGLIFGGIFVVPCAAAFLYRLFRGVEVVSVFGKRSMANMRFTFRKGRAREVYRQICEQAKRRQDDLAAEMARENPVAESPLPPALAPPAIDPVVTAAGGEAPAPAVASGAVSPAPSPELPAPAAQDPVAPPTPVDGFGGSTSSETQPA